MTPTRRWLRRGVLAVAAVIVVIGLYAEAKTVRHHTPAHHPHTAQPSTTTAPPPVDGVYRIEMRRSQQTFDDRPNPQPSDLTIWWAMRSTCTHTRCLAAATALDDADHTRQQSPGAHPLVLEFEDGHWRSRPETVTIACVAPDGSARSQTATQERALRPEARGELVGETVLTVQSDECGQQGGVIRIPTAGTRSGDTPPGVSVSDPASITPSAEPPTEPPGR